MTKKNDLNNLVAKYKPVVKKTGEKLAKAVKSAEEDIAKMYKVAQVHVEIQMKNLQKEKLYHELGKYVAQKLMDETLNINDLEKYSRKLQKVTLEGERMKKTLARASRTSKKRKAAKKK